MRKIEVLEKIKEGIVVREAGDICSIDDTLAAAYIKAGLAKCVETGETGTRDLKPVALNVDPLVIKTAV